MDLDSLRKCLSYDKDTGHFIWLESSSRANGHQKDDRADKQRSGGYYRVKLSGKVYYAHRLAWFMSYGTWPEGQLDHKDGDKSNNRLSNLRLATPVQNSTNQKTPANNTSGVKGVHWIKKKKRWQAQITNNGKQIRLGYFVNFDDAVEARKAAEQIYHRGWIRS